MAHIRKLAPTLDKDQIIVLCLSGRGDKDVYTIAKVLGVDPINPGTGRLPQ